MNTKENPWSQATLIVKLMIMKLNRQKLFRTLLKSKKIPRKNKSLLLKMKILINVQKNKKSQKLPTIRKIVHMNKFLKKNRIAFNLMKMFSNFLLKDLDVNQKVILLWMNFDPSKKSSILKREYLLSVASGNSEPSNLRD